MPAVLLSPIGMLIQVLSDQGIIGNGFKINTYVGGTVSTPQTTYSDSTGTVPNSNPLVMGSNGRFQNVSVWAVPGTLIKMVITDSLNNPLVGGTIDNIPLINDPAAFTAAGIGSILYPQTSVELAAGVTPTNYAWPPGDVRRYGFNADAGVTDNTTAVQNALNGNAGAYKVFVPPMTGYAKLTARVTAPANTHIVMGEGSELRWTATTSSGTAFLGTATRPGIEVQGDNFLIEGRGKITGPATVAAGSGAGGGGVTAFVLNEVGIYRKATSAASRGTGFIVRDVEISLWGSYGILTQYMQDIQLIGNIIHDVGYGAMLHYSAQNCKEYYNKIYGVAPGTAANAYGISHSHDSTGYNTDPLVNATITAITQAASAVVTISTVSGSNPYAIGQNITFFGVAGMTQINGQSAVISAIGGSSGAWTVTVPINSTGYGAFQSTATISGITAANPAVITLSDATAANPYIVGMAVTVSGVNGMTQINGLSALITAVGGVSGAWTITVKIKADTFSAYTSAGITSSGPVIGCPRQAANPFCIDMDCAFNEVRDIPLWSAFDAHGCYEGRYHHNTVYNCHRGLQISAGSGNATGYSGENNRIEDNTVYQWQINGNAATDATGLGTPGIVINGGGITNLGGLHRGVICARNHLYGVGNTAGTSTYGIEATYAADFLIQGNRFQAWNGRGIYFSNSSGVIADNVFDSVGTQANTSAIYVDSNSGVLIVKGNLVNPVTGTLLGPVNGLNAPGTNITAITFSGNDFNAATNPFVNLSLNIIRGASEVPPEILDTTTGSHTGSVAAAGAAPFVSYRYAGGGAATLTSLTGGTVGQIVEIYVSTNFTLTVNNTGATIKLSGGTAAITQYGTLTLRCTATSGNPQFVEIGRSLTNT